MVVLNRRFSQFLRSSSFIFLFSSSILLIAVSLLFSRIAFSSFNRPIASQFDKLGCRPDGEGSWSIGVFYGDSPLSLKPIEDWNERRNESKAWPVANPVLTCAVPTNLGYPSNFVADPFLFMQGDDLYLFFETKNSITLQGDIGVAVSKDNGVTWKHLGIALSEDWHLSYPFVFNYHDQVYMMPEGNKKGELRLYRASQFPLKWEFEKVLLKKPLIDSFIVDYNGLYWLFGSDFSYFGSKKNGELEIYYSNSPLGPWNPHKQNPIHNTNKSYGARNAGRPFLYKGNLYRPGQDCGNTYGHKIRLFKISVLTTDKYEEAEVSLGIKESKKGRNMWNGARYHHLDAQQLPSGKWIAVIDGDRVPSGDSTKRLAFGYIAYCIALLLILLTGVLLSAINCGIPVSLCLPISEKRFDITERYENRGQIYSKIFTNLNYLASIRYGRIKTNTWTGRLVLGFMFLVVVVVTCIGTHYIYGGTGSEEAYPINNHYSQFTMLTMTYDARLWNLKMYVKHYSRCSSVKEIVVVWNKGKPPSSSEFDSAVPVRIRVEDKNSLNNRFKPNPLIKTRAVLELDDDIMMTCDDVERGFKIWRDHPDRIVGFYPRLAEGKPLQYRDERYSRKHEGYNMILTGAAFVDKELAFERYWSKEAKEGREIVDLFFNCEDVLLNFLYVHANASVKNVEYVKPSWAIDTSKFSGVAISKNTQAHYNVRSECIRKFTKLYGNLAANLWRFGSRRDGWDV